MKKTMTGALGFGLNLTSKFNPSDLDINSTKGFRVLVHSETKVSLSPAAWDLG